MRVNRLVTASPISDFEIEGITFEVGGKSKGPDQLRNAKRGYVVRMTSSTVANVVPVGLRPQLLGSPDTMSDKDSRRQGARQQAEFAPFMADRTRRRPPTEARSQLAALCRKRARLACLWARAGRAPHRYAPPPIPRRTGRWRCRSCRTRRAGRARSRARRPRRPRPTPFQSFFALPTKARQPTPHAAAMSATTEKGSEAPERAR